MTQVPDDASGRGDARVDTEAVREYFKDRKSVV